MIQRSQDFRFALETPNAFRIGRESLGKGFQRDFAAELGITRTIHFPHAARANRANDFIGPHPHPWTDPHARVL